MSTLVQTTEIQFRRGLMQSNTGWEGLVEVFRVALQNSKHIFPEKELRGHSPNSYSNFMFLCAIYIFPRSVCIFCCRKIGGPIAGIYKSFTDT
jgi:hypothetical protein